MGSWNETCAISGFPICPGDKIKMILLENCASEPGKTQCNHNDMYAPVAFPISGEYADYGDMDEYDSKGIPCQIILEMLSKRHIPIDEGENQYHERAVPDMKDWDTLMTGLQDGRVIVRHRYADYRKIGNILKPKHSQIVRVYVLEKVWNEIASLEHTDWGNRKTTFDLLYKQGLQHFTAMLERDKLKHTVDYLKGELTPELTKSYFAAMDAVDDVHEFARNFSSMGSGSEGPNECRRIISRRLRDGTLTLESPEFQEMLKGLVELIMVMWQFSSIRFAWHVTCGTGSQEDDYVARVDWHSRLVRIALETDKERRVEYGWGYDEDDPKDPYAQIRALHKQIGKLIPRAPRKKKEK